jgi:hypothetical protein
MGTSKRKKDTILDNNAMEKLYEKSYTSLSTYM